MKNKKKYMEAYDALSLNVQEKEVLADAVRTGRRKHRPKIAVWVRNTAVAAASLAVVFGLANAGTYAYAEESLIQVIANAASGVLTADFFVGGSDQDYIEGQIQTVQANYIDSDYELSVVDYLYDASMQSLYFSVRISRLDQEPVQKKEVAPEDLVPENLFGDSFATNMFSDKQGTISYYLVNEDVIHANSLLLKNSEEEDGLYIYGICENAWGEVVSIYAMDAEGNSKQLYTFALDEASDTDSYEMVYGKTTISVSPFRIRMDSDSGITIRNMTVYYTDGTSFTVMEDGNPPLEIEFAKTWIDSEDCPVMYNVMVNPVKTISSIDYFEIDGEKIPMK